MPGGSASGQVRTLGHNRPMPDANLLAGPLAAVDMGSNSFRLEIGQLQHGRYRRIDYLKDTVRLGAGGHLRGAEGVLGDAAFGEEVHRQADAADVKGLGGGGHPAGARIISVERPPMSMTSLGSSLGCIWATPA